MSERAMGSSVKEVQRKLDLSLEDIVQEDKKTLPGDAELKGRKRRRGGVKDRIGDANGNNGEVAVSGDRSGGGDREKERGGAGEARWPPPAGGPPGQGPPGLPGPAPPRGPCGGGPPPPGAFYPYGYPPPTWGWGPRGPPPMPYRGPPMPLHMHRPPFDPHRPPLYHGQPPPGYPPAGAPPYGAVGRPPLYGGPPGGPYADASGRPRGPPPPGYPRPGYSGHPPPDARGAAPPQAQRPPHPHAHHQAPPAQQAAPCGYQVRLSNVSPELTARDLAEAFGEVSSSRVESVDLLRDAQGRATGESLVVFGSMPDAQNCVRRYHGGDLNGRRLQAIFEGEVVATQR
mmetsp:Transcript_103643/g.263225  ORF Transcript_103643/g.263225 Transcript_103643/m.263225 type:complete len:343 (+) Transcript_103643:70-1098(+)